MGVQLRPLRQGGEGDESDWVAVHIGGGEAEFHFHIFAADLLSHREKRGGLVRFGDVDHERAGDGLVAVAGVDGNVLVRATLKNLWRPGEYAGGGVKGGTRRGVGDRPGEGVAVGVGSDGCNDERLAFRDGLIGNGGKRRRGVARLPDDELPGRAVRKYQIGLPLPSSLTLKVMIVRSDVLGDGIPCHRGLAVNEARGMIVTP